MGADPVTMTADMGIADEPLTADIEQPSGFPPDVEVEEPRIMEVEESEPAEPSAEEAEPEAPVAPTTAKQEILPAQLSKALRELKQAHPEQATALKTLNDAYYAHRAYKEVYGSPDEARADKAAIEALGGQDGIATMRADINSMQEFDRMASEGDPRVIEGLASEFPDGFKRLVPSALERLARTDPEAYRETMRGPLLQMLEGDTVIAVIGSAMEELQTAGQEQEAGVAALHYKNALRELSRIAGWYNNLKQQDKEFKGRYQDPRLGELQTRERALQEQQSNIHWQHYTTNISSYVGDTVRQSLSPLTKGAGLSNDAMGDLVAGVRQEMHKNLSNHEFYMRSVNDLVSQGKTDQAVNFAKPYIDQARKNAVQTVWARRYGAARPSARPAPRPAAASSANGAAATPKAPVSATPVPVNRKPSGEEIDWTKDPDRTLFISGRGYLKTTGKFVTWLPSASRR